MRAVRALGRTLWSAIVYADRHHVPFMASALTFDALIAAVPLIVLVLVGVTHLAQLVAGAALAPADLFHRFLPPHETGVNDPFGRIERILIRVTQIRSTVSLVAIPAFVWLSTRLFASVRTALEVVTESSLKVRRGHQIVIGYLITKLRDVGMVLGLVVFFLLNVALTTLLPLITRSDAWASRAMRFFVSLAGQVLTQAVAATFALVLFYLIYRFGTRQRLSRRGAFAGALFTALGYEILKRGYTAYLAKSLTVETLSRGDADVGAAAFFVLWVYATSLVFLFGGAVAASVDPVRRAADQARRALPPDRPQL